MTRGRVLIAKPGLDGHDRGAKVVARILRDAGYEVIYTGIRQKANEVAAVAASEDVDLIGISVLSGAHIGLTKRLIEALQEVQASDIPVMVGGTIPDRDRARLLELGAAAVFPTGSSSEDIVQAVRRLLSDADELESWGEGV